MALVFVLTAVACGTPQGVSDTAGCADPGESRERHVPASSGDALVPDYLPPGLALESATSADDRVPPATLRLYGDGDRSALLAFEGGSDNGPYLVSSEEAGEGTATRWVSQWLKTDEVEASQVAAVGNGVEADELRSVLRCVDFDLAESDAAAAIPAMNEVAAARVSLAGLAAGEARMGGARISWTGEFPRRVQLVAARHHGDLSAVLRASVDAASDTDIRGTLGRRGPVAIPGSYARFGQVTMWTWTENDLDVVVLVRGIDDPEIERMVASLRPSTAADWEALEGEGSKPPPDGSDELSVSGSFEGGYWRTVIERLPADGGTHFFTSMTAFAFADGRPTGGSGGSVDPSGHWAGVSASHVGVLATGYVSHIATRVEVELEDGSVVEADLRRREGWPVAPYGVLLPPGSAVVRTTAHHPDGTRFETRERQQVGEGGTVGFRMERVGAT